MESTTKRVETPGPPIVRWHQVIEFTETERTDVIGLLRTLREGKLLTSGQSMLLSQLLHNLGVTS